MGEIASNQIVDALEDLVKERNLDKEVIIEILKEAFKAAVKEKYGTTL